MSSRGRFNCLDCGLHAVSHPNMGCKGRYINSPEEVKRRNARRMSETTEQRRRERAARAAGLLPEKNMQDLLADWLIANGFAEAQRGYGHATGEDIAEAMMEVFDIEFKD